MGAVLLSALTARAALSIVRARDVRRILSAARGEASFSAGDVGQHHLDMRQSYSLTVIISMLGLLHVMPASSAARAKLASSERNPYPGCLKAVE